MNYAPSGTNVPAIDTPCAMLAQLRAAYYQLLAGKALAQVRNGDMWTTWHRSDAKALQHEIRRLEVICESGINTGRAVRVGPLHMHHPRVRY
ncbi:hypothetical protein MTR72_24840 [Bradyrhizobium sp. ISRA442]|uniref:gpW family head-tail joining protein n=1 Tax=Bradyrhizobium sp. ISRA442 TaxID=2866197 RepID=UPI00311ADE27